MKKNKDILYLLLILLSYPISAILTLLVLLVEYMLTKLCMGTILVELYPIVSQREATICFFISLNLVGLIGVIKNRK